MNVIGVMPTYMRSERDYELTLKSIETFMATTPSDVKLIVSDDGSPNADLVARLWDFVHANIKRLTIHAAEENQGFACAVNSGLRVALEQGQDAVLVNADMEFTDPGWLDRMSATAHEQPNRFVVGGLLLFSDGLIQHAGIYFSVITRSFDHIHRLAPGELAAAHKRRACPVTGALQYIRFDALETIGLYDEKFRLNFEDVDYCHRVFMAGGECLYNPSVRAIHHESMFKPEKSVRHAEWASASWRYLHQKYAGHSFASYIPTLIWDMEEEVVGAVTE